MTVASIAAEALEFFGSACADISMEKPWEDRFDKRATEWAAKAKKAGCQDLQGAFADFIYNDPATAEDFIGDRLADQCGEDDALHDAVVEELRRRMSWMPPALFDNLSRGVDT